MLLKFVTYRKIIAIYYIYINIILLSQKVQLDKLRCNGILEFNDSDIKSGRGNKFNIY